jgi:hypothetical protein
MMAFAAAAARVVKPRTRWVDSPAGSKEAFDVERHMVHIRMQPVAGRLCSAPTHPGAAIYAVVLAPALQMLETLS